MNGSGAAYLIGTISSTSFTWLATLGRRQHFLPYSIFCASSWGLHPNVTFPWDFQVGVPKLGLLLSQNFGHSYLFQIKFVLTVQEQYLIAFENIFPMVCIEISNWTSFYPWFQGICGQESNSQFDFHPFFCS